MLSVDPPDDDDSDDNKSTGRKSPIPTFTIKRVEGAGGDAGTTNHIGEDVEDSKQDMDGAVIDADEGESHTVCIIFSNSCLLIVVSLFKTCF